jgi:catechol 2,3-dioxygenase-like lactoylglutathione lyase family enzyme
MLDSAKMIDFVATTDYDKARAFYESKLGFEFVSLDQFALVVSIGGHKIRIAKAPNFTPLQGTILGWEVENIEAVVTWLRGRGVLTEKYPFVQDRELGIWTTPNGDKVAWFKDPDGNILRLPAPSANPGFLGIRRQETARPPALYTIRLKPYSYPHTG